MSIALLAIRHLLPIGLVATLISSIFSATVPASIVRVNGFGVEMSVLPEMTAENTGSLIAQVKESGALYIRQEVKLEQDRNLSRCLRLVGCRTA